MTTLGCSSCSLPPAGFLCWCHLLPAALGVEGGLAAAVQWGGLFSFCLLSKSPLPQPIAKPD